MLVDFLLVERHLTESIAIKIISLPNSATSRRPILHDLTI